MLSLIILRKRDAGVSVLGLITYALVMILRDSVFFADWFFVIEVTYRPTTLRALRTYGLKAG